MSVADLLPFFDHDDQSDRRCNELAPGPGPREGVWWTYCRNLGAIGKASTKPSAKLQGSEFNAQQLYPNGTLTFRRHDALVDKFAELRRADRAGDERLIKPPGGNSRLSW